MRSLTILLIILNCFASYGQDSTGSLPQYFENFPYTIGKREVIINTQSITIPRSFFNEVFQFKKDSLNTIELIEEAPYQIIYYQNFKLSYVVKYIWRERESNSDKIIIDASMTIHPWREKKVVTIDEFDKILFREDSLRYILHSKLRNSHETYLFKKLGISYNLIELLSKVDKAYLYHCPDCNEKNKKTIKFRDSTMVIYGKLKRILNDEEKNNLFAILGSDSEFMTPYNTLCFVPSHTLLLADKENNYLGEFDVVTDNCVGYSFKLKIKDGYFYSDASIFYKGFEKVNSILKK